VQARYSKPFYLHGAIGPSAAVAQYDLGRLTVWSHSQGVEILRLAIAEVVGLPPEAVSAIHVDGAGCYGHNGADDAAVDAALVAMAMPGTPISLKWTRHDEHAWEPAGPAMTVRMAGGVEPDGRIGSWSHDTYTYAHGGRPRPTGRDTSGLLASWYLDTPAGVPTRREGGGFHSGGHRNADPYYRVGHKRVVKHFVAPSPLRTSSLRSLGAFANTFAIESFMDELAVAAGADPVDFRLAHLDDPRARAVIEAAVTLAGGMEAPGGIDAPGRGLAFARYENVKTYVAIVAEVDVDPRTGVVRVRHGWIAADAGQIIDPDGLANQLEGGFVQAASWTLMEELGFDEAGVTTTDWDSYPILKFSEAPTVTTTLLDHPMERSLGAGEASTGPTPAAIANAVYQATGVRLRDLPLRPDRVKSALAANLRQ
jgi:CO/xanthine dehydrogenase Mo-binding subunit